MYCKCEISYHYFQDACPVILNSDTSILTSPSSTPFADCRLHCARLVRLGAHRSVAGHLDGPGAQPLLHRSVRVRHRRPVNASRGDSRLLRLAEGIAVHANRRKSTLRHKWIIPRILHNVILVLVCSFSAACWL